MFMRTKRFKLQDRKFVFADSFDHNETCKDYIFIPSAFLNDINKVNNDELDPSLYEVKSKYAEEELDLTLPSQRCTQTLNKAIKQWKSFIKVLDNNIKIAEKEIKSRK
jgi:hypothetical protein